jgi:hypothetical protein
VLRGWGDDAALRDLFGALLADAPFRALRWEMPVLATTTLPRDFECVLLDSPWLEVPADASAFAEHFPPDCARGVVSFPNLGGDALLLAPCPLAADSPYAHLAAFLRAAPGWQQHALWQALAETLAARIGTQPLWLSTAGAAVPWLHLRLDERPKYYGYPPYTAWPAATREQ